MTDIKTTNIVYSEKKTAAIDVLFIVSLSVACTRDYGNKRIGIGLQSAISLMWILLAAYTYYVNMYKNKTYIEKECKNFLHLYLKPQIILYLYTIFVMLLGLSDWDYLSSNVSTFSPILLVIASVYLFRERAFNYICISVVLSWLLSVIIAVSQNGFYIFIQGIIQGYIDQYFRVESFVRKNYLEIHDIVLAAGYFLVYYVCKEKNNKFINKKWQNKFIFYFLVVSVLGFKRIAILGIAVSLLFHFIIKYLKFDKTKICLLSGSIIIIFCYFFVYSIADNDLFYDLVNGLNINTSGRIRYYRRVMEGIPFSLFFLGKGRGYVTKQLSYMLTDLHVGGVHSDILKIYIESGFILFGYWLYYSFYYITKYYAKRFGGKSAVMYFCIVLYMFVLYLTDNTDTYFVCRILYMIIPIDYAIKQHKYSENYYSETIKS